MNSIKLHGIRTYSYHGCLKEESIVGGNYLVNVSVDCDFKVAATEDDLAKTVDYVELKNIVIPLKSGISAELRIKFEILLFSGMVVSLVFYA